MSGLLAKTLRSRTFNLALIWIGVFGLIVVALFGYVRQSTSSYVLSRSDRGIEAQHAVLRKAYETAGRSGLIAAIERSIAEERFEDGLYLLADPSLVPVAGNLKMWPPALQGAAGLENFTLRALQPDAADRPVLRGI
jgi:hypothetical protein